MNYRNIIKSRDLRIKILSYLDWIPDSVMLRLQYWLQTGRWLHVKHPRRFTEKLQVYKMKYRNPDMLRCTDKYEVRSYVEEKGLGKYLIPLIGIYDRVCDIDFKSLPNQFVAKTTDGGGGNQVLVCKDKSMLPEKKFQKKLQGWMAMPKAKNSGREWAYENGFPRRILIEKYICDEKAKDLPDYKFYCFNGEPRYCQLIQNRAIEETIDFYDMEWNHMPFYGLNVDFKQSEKHAEKPVMFEEMKRVAKNLSMNYPFARIDMYSIDDTVYFGEVTFYPASGYGRFTPDEWDITLGNALRLDELSQTGGGNAYKESNDDLIDYKFLCFNGKVACVYGISERRIGESAQLGVYDVQFNKQDVYRQDEKHQNVALPKPLNFNKMLEIAETLSKDFPHVRVDLYNINGRIFFGELTFYDGSGYMRFKPDDFDFALGSKMDCSLFVTGSKLNPFNNKQKYDKIN